VPEGTEDQDQLAATTNPKRVIKKSVKGQAAADANGPVEEASTYGELKTKHKDFNTFMASPDATRANMDVWYAENEKRLATTDKNGPKAKALQRQQTKLRGATPAPVAAPQAAPQAGHHAPRAALAGALARRRRRWRWRRMTWCFPVTVSRAS
jgi:hypothetical protein